MQTINVPNKNHFPLNLYGWSSPRIFEEKENQCLSQENWWVDSLRIGSGCTLMMFHFQDLRRVFDSPDGQLQNTDGSNWPKVSILCLNHHSVYTSSPLSRSGRRYNHEVRSNCQTLGRGQCSLWGTWATARRPLSLQLDACYISPFEISTWKWQEPPLALWEAVRGQKSSSVWPDITSPTER